LRRVPQCIWLRKDARCSLVSARPKKPTFIFTLGLPGSGKTAALKKRWGLENLTILDLDLEMRKHPKYDPQNRSSVYDDPDAYVWANAEVQKRLDGLCTSRPLVPLVALDGTGTHIERQISRFQQVRSAGYHVLLLHVRVSLEKALERNLTRRRQVPETVMRRYLDVLEKAVEAQRPLVDEYLLYDNEADDGHTGRERWKEWYDLYYEKLAGGSGSAYHEATLDLSVPLFGSDGKPRKAPIDPKAYQPTLSGE
jgi:hypothetical protein